MTSFTLHSLTETFVLIADNDEGMSVTNNAARVVRHLHDSIEGGLGKRHVYYQDTMGRFDELCHDQGKFTGFAPCSRHQQDFLLNLANQ